MSDQLVGFLELAPVTGKPVTLAGQQVAMQGVSLGDIANILSAHPDLLALVAKEDRTDLTVERMVNILIKSAPVAVATIITYGVGMPGHKKALEIASKLVLGDQIHALTKIIEFSLRSDLGPLEQQLETIMALIEKDGPSLEERLNKAVDETMKSAMPSPS